MKAGVYRFVLNSCPACESSREEFKKFEKKGKPNLTANATIKEVDSEDPLTKKLNITAFPTYLIVTKSGKMIEQQERDSASLLNQAKKHNICGSKTKFKKRKNKLSRRK
jgi:hypothetical protein